MKILKFIIELHKNIKLDEFKLIIKKIFVA